MTSDQLKLLLMYVDAVSVYGDPRAEIPSVIKLRLIDLVAAEENEAMIKDVDAAIDAEAKVHGRAFIVD